MHKFSPKLLTTSGALKFINRIGILVKIMLILENSENSSILNHFEQGDCSCLVRSAASNQEVPGSNPVRVRLRNFRFGSRTWKKRYYRHWNNRKYNKNLLKQNIGVSRSI